MKTGIRKQISANIDTYTIELLLKLRYATGKPKYAIIDEAILHYAHKLIKNEDLEKLNELKFITVAQEQSKSGNGDE